MTEKDNFIAVFDSGVGGISVLRHLRRILPQERYLYFGDSANAPYGSRPTAEVRELTLNAAEKLFAQGCKALVVACNTATSAAIDTLRQKYPDKIIIGIEPAVKPAVDRFPGGYIGVLATEVTLREEKFNRLLTHYGEKSQVVRLPAPGLVELIEGGKTDSEETESLLRQILSPHLEKLDALVLGCTHYPFVSAVLRRIVGEDVLLIDGGEGTARETRRRLEAAGLLRSGQGEVIWQSSSDDPNFPALCQCLLERN